MSDASRVDVNLDALASQLGFTHFVIQANTEGLTHEDSLVQPAPEGNCMNWVLGHMILARSSLMRLLGLDPIWAESDGDTYRGGGPPLTDPAKAVGFEQLMSDFEASQVALTQALGEFPAERFTEKAPFSPTDNPDETLGSLIAGLVFHDAYHAGQTGLLRRIVGRPGAIG